MGVVMGVRSGDMHARKVDFDGRHVMTPAEGRAARCREGASGGAGFSTASPRVSLTACPLAGSVRLRLRAGAQDVLVRKHRLSARGGWRPGRRAAVVATSVHY